MTRSLLLLVWSLGVVLFNTRRVALAQDGDGGELTPVTISHQPAVYWFVPAWIALKEGFFEDLGLNVSLISYPSGAPQVADAEAWDVGGAGCVPNIIGGQQGISTIGISNDESATNALLGNMVGSATWESFKNNLTGVPVAITPNSTGHYAALKCLTDMDPSITDDAFIYEQQPEVMASMTPNGQGVAQSNFGALWAPNMYKILEDINGSTSLCSGKTAGATVPGGIMVRDDFGNESPELVARIMTGWLRGIGFTKNPDKRDQAIEYLNQFYAESDVKLSENAVLQEFVLRPLFDLDDQLQIMMRRDDGQPSEVDLWYNGVSQFLLDGGVLSEIPPESNYITDKYLQMINEDEFLRDYAHRSDVDYVSPETEEPSKDTTTSGSSRESSRLLLAAVAAILALF